MSCLHYIHLRRICQITEMKIKVTLLEGMLGMSPADKEVYRTYIGSNAPDAASLTEEMIC